MASHLTDKVSYIRGLMEGMKFDTESDQGKLLDKIVELLDDMAEEIGRVFTIAESCRSILWARIMNRLLTGKPSTRCSGKSPGERRSVKPPRQKEQRQTQS